VERNEERKGERKERREKEKGMKNRWCYRGGDISKGSEASQLFFKW
jgi:hypothetical protein